MAQRGYILIFVLAILLFLVGTVTGAAYALRLGAQEGHQQRERLRAEFRVRGALHYALAQFALAAATPAPAAGKSANDQNEQPRPGWPLEESSQSLQIDGIEVEVAIEDPGGIADANALDEHMWTDYFAELLHAPSAEARRLGAALVAWKERVGKTNGRGGFASIDEMLMPDALPVSARYGGAAAGDDADAASQGLQGFADLFMVGTGERVFDVNRAALPLLAAATGAGADRLAAYDAARQRARLSLAEAVRILGERARPLLQETRTDPVYRIVLSTQTGIGTGRMRLAAFVQRREGLVRVLSSRLGTADAANAQP
ncbi:MAG: hypothetical protein A3G25_05335 [Betaproteobacteria bacterium RIFCSPLOWO2_12_FULL_63_13]|nr:MAG: hypothetical protein A3G25_05335 [Betaproteobacteria bacterium RIFCSPLOWO2_12_FULL_63_13]